MGSWKTNRKEQTVQFNGVKEPESSIPSPQDNYRIDTFWHTCAPPVETLTNFFYRVWESEMYDYTTFQKVENTFPAGLE